MDNEQFYQNMDICISDSDPGFYNIEEIIGELMHYYNNFSTHSMNDNRLYLRGQRDMLGKIIVYLHRVGNSDLVNIDEF